MDSDSAQRAWDEHQARIRRRRIGEAEEIWHSANESGNSVVNVIIKFAHFSMDESSARALAAQLSENYEMTVEHRAEDRAWIASGTTAPAVCGIDRSALTGWAEFMVDVAHSHGCTFSDFSLRDPDSDRIWSNEGIEVDDN